VPDPTVAVQRVGQRTVDLPARGAGRRGVHRRTHERVPQLDLAVPGPQQPGPLDRVERVAVDPQRRGRLPHRRDPPGVVGGSDQQQRLRGGGEASGAVEEDPLDTLGHRQLGWQGRLAAELCRGQRAG
jgi:hypothetical protein